MRWGCVLLALSIACGQAIADDELKYPYVATPERQRQIKEGFSRIKIGDIPEGVKNILGSPDEVRPLLEPVIVNPRRIGTTWWYLLEKKSKDDNINAKLVRVSLDLGNKVTKIDRWGFADEK